MALTQISTQGIKDGTITNADLNASAAIARTKLANVDLVDDTSPQLGGNLDTNGNLVIFPDSNGTTNRLLFGTNKFQMYYNSGNSRMQIDNITGDFSIRNQASGGDIDIIAGDDIRIRPQGGENGINLVGNGAVELYHDNAKKFETFANGITVSSDNAQLEIESSSSGTSTAFGVFKGYRIVADVGRLAELQFINQRDNDVQAEIEVIANGDTNSYFDFKTSNAGLRSLRIHNTGTHLPDNFTANYGNSNDLQIYHDGSNSYIDDTATGNLVIRSNQINFDKYTGEALARFRADGNCELFHNNVSKFETTSSGVTISGTTIANGHIRVRDHTGTEDGQIMLGAGNDLRIYHNGAHSYLDNSTGSFFVRGDTIKLRGKSADEDLIEAFVNGSVRLYHNNSIKLETTSSGIQVTGQVYTDSAHVNGELDLVGNLDLNSDSHKIKLGAGDDFQLYHNGSNNYIFTNNGDIIMQTDGDDIQLLANDDIILKVQGGVETAINCVGNGAVELYHDNSKKFETTSSGVEVTGVLELAASSGSNPSINNADGGSGNNLYFNTGGSIRLVVQDNGHTRPASNNTYDLGTSNDRWRNIYTNDLNLSNEGGSNDVDGTWGSYTIQEGAEDLFLIKQTQW